MNKNNFLIISCLLLSSVNFAQVGIGTTTPHNSAVLHLDVSSLPANGKKGFLGPKVALTSRTDATTIPSPAVGLLVYNLGTGGLATEGYLFWNGSEWRRFDSSTTTSPSISTLDCSNIRLEPSIYTAGQAYSGVLIVPYTNGNGGSYSNGTAIASTAVTGLNAILNAGTLAFGRGEFVFNVTGTPSATSPTTTNFAIPALLGAPSGCTATVGAGNALKIGEAITASYRVPIATATTGSFDLGSYVTTNNLTPLPSIDGLQANLLGNSSSYYYPRIFNRATSNQIISYQTFATVVNQNKTALNLTLTPNSYTDVDTDVAVYWSTANAEVITTNVQVPVNATTFRWYEFKWWCMEVSSNKIIFISVTRVL